MRSDDVTGVVLRVVGAYLLAAIVYAVVISWPFDFPHSGSSVFIFLFILVTSPAFPIIGLIRFLTEDDGISHLSALLLFAIVFVIAAVWLFRRSHYQEEIR